MMERWRKIRLGDFCVTNADSYSPREKWDFVNYLDTGNITNNTIDSIQYIDIKSEKLPSRARRKVKRNSIIYSTVRPNQRHFGIIKSQPENFLVSTGFAVIDVNTNVLDADFLYYLLTQDALVEALHAIAEQSTSAYPSIKPSDLENLEIEIPDLDTQKKIADVLSSLDRKITQNTDVNENLYQQLASYYRHLFSAIIPSTSVGELADSIFSGGTPSTSNETYWNGQHNWLSSGETSDRFIVSTIKTITDAGVSNSSTRKANKYDIVIASAGQGHTRGQASMLLTDAYVNQSIIVIHAASDYLPYLFWNIANRYEELRVISNSNSIRGSLTTKMIGSLSIPKVNITQIQQFSDYAWPIVKTIENNLHENCRLAVMRDTLLPRLMSGELDVSALDL